MTLGCTSGWQFIVRADTHIHKGVRMETQHRGEEGGRSDKIPTQIINGAGLDFMNLTLFVT